MADRQSGARALKYAEPYDPGRDAAARHPDWVIRHRNLHGVPEVMCPERKVILIEDAHDHATRRSNLAHAIAHVDLGHQATAGVLSARQELAADKLAARRLIDVWSLADGVVWCESYEELAHLLLVDQRMLWVRGKHLHPAERSLVFRRLEEKQFTA